MTGLIEATTQFWGQAERHHSEEKLRTVNNLVLELTDRELVCFDSPLYLEDWSDCDETDERCPFYDAYRKHKIAKVVQRQRNKWQRELDEAVRKISTEKEAT